MVSDSDLVGRLREFLSTSDLNTTTAAIVRRQLEEDFGIDLSDKKAFIREQIDAFLQHYSGEGDEKDGNDEESKEIKYEENGGDDSEGRGQEKEVEEEEVEEEEDEDEEAGNGKTRAKRKSSQSEVKKRGGGGFTKLCSLSPKLQKFTGVPELARTEVVKQLWAYIREKNLQDPSNRRNINCDDTLRDLFGVNTINMFQMNKVLAKHIWPLDSDGAAPVDPSPSKEKEKPRKKGNGKDPSEWKSTEKRQKTGNSGILAALPLSDALIKFLGTGENTLSRPEAVSRLWHYIKNYNLQDPSDKRRILCDEKLKELFGVDTFNGFSVTKLLSAHFMKAENLNQVEIKKEKRKKCSLFLIVCSCVILHFCGGDCSAHCLVFINLELGVLDFSNCKCRRFIMEGESEADLMGGNRWRRS